MTYKEAHEYLENKQREYTKNRHLYDEDAIEANGIAIEAIEKQMSMKVKDDGIDYVCPFCGSTIFRYHNLTAEEVGFCCICGKAISWEGF